MTPLADAPPAGRPGTVWKRTLGLFVVCMVAVGVLALGLIVGVIPVAFGIGGNPIQLTIGKLEGTTMTAYIGTDDSIENGGKPGAIAGLEGGQIHDLCLSTVLDLPVVGELTVLIRSGESEPIPFTEMTAFAGTMGIDGAVAKNVQLGVDGGTLNNLVRGPDGSWALRIGNVTVDNLKATGDQADVGELRLRGLGLELLRGSQGC